MLKEALLTVTSQEECKKRLSLVSNVGIDDKKICAVDRSGTGDPSDACQGDSGGPLSLSVGGRFQDSIELNPDRSARWVLIGVVSFGYYYYFFID